APCGKQNLTLFITVQIKPNVEQKVGGNFHDFTAVEFCKQLVNGFNYLIKVHSVVDELELPHLSVPHITRPISNKAYSFPCIKLCLMFGERYLKIYSTPSSSD
uniref:Uncharacterized protein n=1 Tax=Leptobrachium leishanense TaxID=445787 RepID=A0A8C5QW95_9ANUR